MQIKATEQHSRGAVYKVVQGSSNSESVDETLKCDHPNEI